MPAESAEVEETEAVEPEPAAEAEESEPAVEDVEEAAEPETDDGEGDAEDARRRITRLCVPGGPGLFLYLSALRDVLRRRSRKLVVSLFGVPVCRTCFDLEQACIRRCGAPEAERVEAFLEGGPYIFK